MFSLIEKGLILVLSTISSALRNCLLLKNQECKVRKVITENDYMTFPFKIGVNRCVGSCNDEDNLYFKVCLPDSVKNIK